MSDEEMSLLWAQLLAGEVHSPGTYSPRAVNMLADMDKSKPCSSTAFAASK